MTQRKYRGYCLLYLIVCFMKNATSELACARNEIELLGAGSQFPAPLYKELGPAYAANRSFFGRTVLFSFTKISSDYGKDRILQRVPGEKPILFAASEALLSKTDAGSNRNLKTFPVIAGAVMITYNLPNLDNLTIHVRDLAKIFSGEVNRWNDEILMASNPGVKLPDERIRVVVRGDSDGDTDAFTGALSSFSKTWEQKYGRFEGPRFVNDICCNSTTWPAHAISFFGNKITGMVGIVASIPYTIGYGALSDTQGVGIRAAALINMKGATVKPETAAIQAAMDYHLKASYGSVTFDLSNALDAKAYPICTFSYMIINISTAPGITCCQMEELAGFLDWFMFDPRSNEVAERNSVVKLTQNVAQEVLRGTLRAISCDGISVFDSYRETLNVHRGLAIFHIGVIAGCSAVAVAVLIGVTVFVHRKIANATDEGLWMLLGKDIKILCDADVSSMASSSRLSSSVKSDPLSPGGSTGRLKFLMIRAYHDGHDIFLNELKLPAPKSWKGSTKRDMLWLRNTVLHANLLILMGITVRENVVYSVYECAAKGTLHETLRTTKYDMVDSIKYSFATGITEAMKFLHKKEIIHSSLSSLTCYISSTWTIKVSQWESSTLYLHENKRQLEIMLKSRDAPTAESLIRLLYLDADISSTNMKPSADVYSFGLLLIEIFTLKLPFRTNVEEGGGGGEIGSFTYMEIIREKFFSHGKLLPKLPDGIPSQIRELIYQCVGDVKGRPTFHFLSERLATLNASTLDIIDIMMDQMNIYSKDLEKTNKELQKLNTKMRDLLHEVLPPPIAEKLFRGEQVQPEYFEETTICFADIVGFTDISSRSLPREVMSFLNDLWVMFDSVITTYDVYKVDTIGDAYLVCSGLPTRNGHDHVRQISMLCLTLIDKTKHFSIRHMPEEQLRIRIGFNSGSCMTGVVGTKMPQYCVFGNTMNIAAKMEASSQPLKIQIGETSHELLQQHYPDFKTEYRGEIDVEGFPMLKSYWLTAHERGSKGHLCIATSPGEMKPITLG